MITLTMIIKTSLSSQRKIVYTYTINTRIIKVRYNSMNKEFSANEVDEVPAISWVKLSALTL